MGRRTGQTWLRCNMLDQCYKARGKERKVRAQCRPSGIESSKKGGGDILSVLVLVGPGIEEQF